MEKYDKSNFAREVALLIAKNIKELTGKGPTKRKVYILDNLILFKISGFLSEGEIILCKTEQGKEKVKQYRLELAKVINENIRGNLNVLIGLEPNNIYFDCNPEIDEGIMVLSFMDNLSNYFTDDNS